MQATWGWALLLFIVGCAATTDGASVDGGALATTTVPRPIAPLSTATVTSQSPTLHWARATDSDGTHVQICHDRACGTVEQTLDATGTLVTVPVALTAGVHFWRLAARSGTTVASTWSPTWEFFVGHRSAPVDTSWGTVADFNGDGYADLVVEALVSGGLTYDVYPGSATAPDASPAATIPTLFGDYAWSIASAGDVNGDGYADLVVGAPPVSSDLALPPMVYLYLGGPNGLGTTPTVVQVPNVINSWQGVVASAGDVNGDGYADLVVVTGAGPGGYLYLGSATGVSTAPIGLSERNDSAGFGFYTVAGAGDVNADGYADILVGDAGNAVTVLMGGPSGFGANPAILTLPNSDPSNFIRLVASAGDVNGDGYADLIVGPWSVHALGAGVNPAYVYLGSRDGPIATPITLTNPTAGGSDSAVASAGDLNGDGYSDLMVGAMTSDTAYVYYGSATGPGTSPTTLTGPSSFGYSVNGVGDLNGDGFDDCAVGAPASNTVDIYLGSANGLSMTPTTLVDPSGSLDGSSFSPVASAGPSRGRRSPSPVRTCAATWGWPPCVGSVWATTARVEIVQPAWTKHGRGDETRLYAKLS